MTNLRTLIAVGEKQDVSKLASLIAANPILDLIAVCPYGNALDAIAAHNIDLVILDIDAEEAQAFELSGHLQRGNSFIPATIFVGSEASYAARAFDVRATDYVLKPLEKGRFAIAVDYAVDHVIRHRAAMQQKKITSTRNYSDLEVKRNRHKPSHASRIVVRDAGRIQLIKVENIEIVEADGRDCLIHHNRLKHRVVGPLRHLAERLSVDSFIQISRSILVNIDRITELQEMCKGRLIVVMRSGHELSISRRFRSRVMQQLTVN